MKFCFLINDAPFLSEFLGKICSEALKDRHQAIVAVDGKIAEYTKERFFPTGVKFISEVDWCLKNFNSNQKEFGTLSWREFFSAFGRYTTLNWDYRSSTDTVSRLYQFFDFIFQHEKPHVVISEPPAGVFGEIAYYFAKKNGVPFLGITDSRVDLALYDSEATDSRFEKTFRKISDSEIQEDERKRLQGIIDTFVFHKKPLAYMNYAKTVLNQFELTQHYLGKIAELKPLFWYFLHRSKFKQYDYESEVALRRSVTAPLKLELKQIRILLQKRFFSRVSWQDRFFVYPLHLEPESATLILAIPYADQLATIKNIAFSLPFPCKLYVKEHPTAVGSRQDAFYKTLKNIPNVVLISADANVPELVQKSMGVITLTGTMGMEAALQGKSAYVLGNVFYTYHPLCRKVQNFDDLKNRIEADLLQKPDTSDLENINVRFMASYVRNTIKGGTMYAADPHDPNDYPAIYAAIKERTISLTNHVR